MKRPVVRISPTPRNLKITGPGKYVVSALKAGRIPRHWTDGGWVIPRGSLDDFLAALRVQGIGGADIEFADQVVSP